MNKDLTLLEEFECIVVDLVPLAKEVNKESIKAVEKSLKALEIIKEIIPIEEEDFFYDKETDTYFFIGHKVSKNQYELLKEVLK